MGAVYEAQDTRLPRSVAIKFLTPALSRNVRAVQRFKREARLASLLNHPNICTILDVDEGHQECFIAMELLQGVSLKERLASGPVSLVEILDVGTQVAAALEAAHQQGIMHRDITPGNIYMTATGLVKVLDFGLAKQFASFDDEAGTDGLTEPGSIAGTLHYMAPEQLQEDATVDHRCDLFSFGAVLYQMATGSRPFQARSQADLAIAIQEQPHIPVRQLAPHHSAQLEAVVDKLLAKHPEDRYQDASTLRRDLEGIQRGEVTHAPLVSKAAGSSVAVLPFEIIGSGGARVEEFCAGLGEAIRSSLGRIQHVSVAPRTSTDKVIGDSVREIGNRLGVQLIIEGSVQPADGRFRIVATLLDASTERATLPSVRIERRLDDMLAAQDGVAREIVSSFADGLTRPSGRQLTRNPGSYHAFKRGQHYLKTLFSGGWRLALEQFQYAVECDDEFAVAHAALGAVYNFLGFYSLLKPKVAFEVAGRSLRRALTIDDTLAVAHAELGLMKFGGHWDWDGAEEEFRRALRIDPNCTVAHVYYSWLLVLLGRDGAGLVEAETAYAQAPTSRFIAAGRAQALYLAHQYDEAIELCNECLGGDADYPYALHLRAQSYREKSMHEEALVDLDRAAAVTNRAPFYLGLLGHCCAYQGMQKRVLDIIAELDCQAREIYVPPQCYVYTYAGLGQRQKALEHQEQAYEDGASPLNYLTPFIRSLYALDPGQKRRLEQMRLAV